MTTKELPASVGARLLSINRTSIYYKGTSVSEEELVNAEKYEHSSDRQRYRSGHYKRNLHTTAGEIELKVPKLKGVPFETALSKDIAVGKQPE